MTKLDVVLLTLTNERVFYDCIMKKYDDIQYAYDMDDRVSRYTWTHRAHPSYTKDDIVNLRPKMSWFRTQLHTYGYDEEATNTLFRLDLWKALTQHYYEELRSKGWPVMDVYEPKAPVRAPAVQPQAMCTHINNCPYNVTFPSSDDWNSITVSLRLPDGDYKVIDDLINQTVFKFNISTNTTTAETMAATPKPTKEKKTMKQTVETKTYVNDQDVANMSKAQLLACITSAEKDIADYEAVKTESKFITSEIKRLNNFIKDVVKLLDK